MRILFATLLLVAASVSQATDDSFDSRGVKIRYVTAGEGEAVILIHGWMADATMWGKDASGNPKLDVSALPGFRAIALDCRGHGKSDKPHDARRYGVEMAKDVVRLMDHLKIRRAHLVGYSMGAFIAGKVVSDHPDRVLSVVYGGQTPILRGRPTAGGSEVEVFARTVDEGRGLGEYIQAVAPDDRPKPTPELASALAKMMFNGKDVVAFAAAGRSLGKLGVKPASLAKVPTLFLFGDHEAASTKDNVAFLVTVIKDARSVEIPNANHVTALGKPQFGASIVEFLKSYRASGD